MHYFIQEKEIVQCSNVESLKNLGISEYDSEDWRRVTDIPKRSVNYVCQHNCTTYGYLPLGHSTTLKKTKQN